jgi:hypothetical protein
MTSSIHHGIAADCRKCTPVLQPVARLGVCIETDSVLQRSQEFLARFLPPLQIFRKA